MKKGLSLILILITLACLSVCAMAANDIYTVEMDVAYGQTEARSMLSLINELREPENAWYWNSSNTEKLTFSNLQDLVYDYELEKVAMQRAAEIALYFSHTRPDGSRCFSAYDTLYYSSAGENIAIGHRNAEAVFTAWAEEFDPYSGQGHRRNMLDGDFKSVGIGHAVVNGVHCWVQEFRAPKVSQTVTPAVDTTKTVSIDINKSYFSLDINVNVIKPNVQTVALSMSKGESIDIPVTVTIVNPAFPYVNNTLKTSVTYSVADKSIATVENGKIKALSYGTTKVTIYALWGSATIDLTVSAPKYSVRYNANGGTGTMADSSHTYGVKKALSANKFTRTGYTFAGWSKYDPKATTPTYKDKQIVSGLTGVDGKVVNLYAVWKPINYSVKYNANGGTGTMSNSSHTYGTGKALTANKYTRTGYTFLGWSKTKNATTASYTDKQVVKGLTGVNGRVVNLYAVWKPITYKVSYNANGGTGTMANSSHTFGTAKALSANKYTRTGYTFLGWSKTKNATTASYTDCKAVSGLTGVQGKTVVLYAVWKPITYSVKYHANGGTGSMSNSSHTFGTAKALSANKYTRTGYIFLGWSKTKNATTASYTDCKEVSGLTGVQGKTVVLYAVWKPITYKVSYNANGGKGTMSNSAHTFGVSKALSSNTFTRSGYTFLGWSKTKNATTATYKNKQAVSGLTGVQGKTVTLYAVWKKK